MTLIREAKALQKKIQKEIGKRQEYFSNKPESWQESVTGDKYAAKTEHLQLLWEYMGDALFS